MQAVLHVSDRQLSSCSWGVFSCDSDVSHSDGCELCRLSLVVQRMIDLKLRQEAELRRAAEQQLAKAAELLSANGIEMES